MAELHVAPVEKTGIMKEIDDGALDLIFAGYQEDMYAHPIESFIRESISNGLDANVEKNIFKKISKGKPVEDFYRQKQDGQLLKDSEYDPSYYDTKHTSKNNVVSVRYMDGNPRDTVTITDQGVGLGGKRLQGFFKLGYSSKRNMKAVIGKFGAGAKAALSTGVEYFTMHTTYMGYTTSFMILSRDYDPITPESELGKTEVWTVKLINGEIEDRKIHWTKTNEPNGVTIEMEVKKHNKDAYLAAVRNQFQYFGGKVTLEHNEDNTRVFNTLSERPLYESKALLIPKYSTYNSPHILVDGIAYGLISWPELELQRRTGKIAIKVAATDVDITQNRETLKWTEKTKSVVLNAVKAAEEEASEYITSLVKIADDKNVFDVNNIYGSIGKSSDNEVSSVFSKFLDMYSIRPKVKIEWVDPDNPGIMLNIKTYLSKDLFEALFYKYTVKRVTMQSHGDSVKLHSTIVDNFDDLRNARIIYSEDTNLGPKLAEHLMNTKYDCNSLIYIRPGSTRVKDVVEIAGSEYSAHTLKRYTRTLLQDHSDLFLDDYDVVYENDVEDLDKAKVKLNVNNLAKQRKLNKEVLFMEYEDVAIDNDVDERYTGSNRSKHTVKISELPDELDGHDIIITTGKFKNLAKMVETVQWIVEPNEYKRDRIIHVAQDLVPHFAPFGTVITDYFITVNKQTGELMLGEHIRNLNTMRLLSELRDKYSGFSTNFRLLEAVTDIDISELKKLTGRMGRRTFKDLLMENGGLKQQELDEVLKYLDTLNAFQHIVSSGNAEDIAKAAKDMFNSDKVFTVDAYDKDLVDKVESEFKRLAVANPVLELMPDSISMELSDLLKLLITTKNNANVNI
jgi:hypothetical protein